MGKKDIALTDSRNYGVDILKLIAMFLVVVLHSYSKGVYPRYDAAGINDDIGFFIEALSYCCVNCFALASGYLGSISASFRYRRIASLWVQAVFYCIVITIFTMYFYPNLIGEDPIKTALMPVTHKTYWYLTAYIGVFFFMPILNSGFKSLSENQAVITIIGIIAVFVGAEYFSKSDLFNLSIGYSVIWLTVLYVLGGALHRAKLERFFRKSIVYFILYLIFCSLAWFGKWYNEHQSVLAGGFKADTIYLQYTSLPILLSSIFLLLFCTSIKVNNEKAKKIIKLLSSASFGVYLIHVHPLVFSMPFWDKFRALYSASPMKMVISALLGAILIYVVCLSIDILRIQLFRILHIDKAIDYLADNVSFKRGVNGNRNG